jgi:hypothetical protein
MDSSNEISLICRLCDVAKPESRFVCDENRVCIKCDKSVAPDIPELVSPETAPKLSYRARLMNWITGRETQDEYHESLPYLAPPRSPHDPTSLRSPYDPTSLRSSYNYGYQNQGLGLPIMKLNDRNRVGIEPTELVVQMRTSEIRECFIASYEKAVIYRFGGRPPFGFRSPFESLDCQYSGERYLVYYPQFNFFLETEKQELRSALLGMGFSEFAPYAGQTNSAATTWLSSRYTGPTYRGYSDRSDYSSQLALTIPGRNQGYQPYQGYQHYQPYQNAQEFEDHRNYEIYQGAGSSDGLAESMEPQGSEEFEGPGEFTRQEDYSDIYEWAKPTSSAWANTGARQIITFEVSYQIDEGGVENAFLDFLKCRHSELGPNDLTIRMLTENQFQVELPANVNARYRIHQIIPEARLIENGA